MCWYLYFLVLVLTFLCNFVKFIMFWCIFLKGQPSQVKPPSPPASHSAPQLQEPIRDLQANEGDSIQFHCKIAGTPEPVVQWYYNNQIIKPSKYFQMSSENGYHTLTIAGVFPEDEGTYKCTARNPVGEINSIGHLKVIRKHLD